MSPLDEIRLMALEARLDRIQNESRKALGELRAFMDNKNRRQQKTLMKFGIGEPWRHEVRGYLLERGREILEGPHTSQELVGGEDES